MSDKRVYRGYIQYTTDEELLIAERYNLPVDDVGEFVVTGEWFGRGNKRIASYVLKDAYEAWQNGEADYPAVQFSRGRRGFYIETVD